MATHKHWPGDDPRYASAPWCLLPTKKACDEVWTQFQHGHMGVACVKAIQPSKTRKGEANKIATCTLVQPPGHGPFVEQLRAARETLLARLHAAS